MLESTLQTKFINLVKLNSLGIAVKVDSTSRRGWPDLVLVDWKGDITLIEIKADTGKLSLHQQELHAELIELGCDVVTLTGEGRVNRFIEMLTAELLAG